MTGQSLRMTLNGDQIQTADLNQLLARGSLYPALKRAHGRIGFQQFREDGAGPQRRCARAPEVTRGAVEAVWSE